MLSIILIVLLGRTFYRLAEEFNQHRWLFAVLGIISYYVGSAIGGVVVGLVDVLFDLGVDFDNSGILLMIAIPFGLGTSYILYYILKRKWKNEVVVEKDEIQDIGKDIDNA